MPERPSDDYIRAVFGMTPEQFDAEMAKQQPPKPPDFAALAKQDADASRDAIDRQTQTNRPNTTNAAGSTINWTQGPGGQWTQQQSFGGPLAGAAQNLQQQIAGSFGQPFNVAPFSFGGPMQATQAPNLGGPFSFQGLQDPGSLMDPMAARQQAFDSAYSQSTSRLDPQWQQRETQQRSQLLNQGLDPESEAYKNAMQSFGQQRNDAYQGATNAAIGASTDAGNALFGQSLAGRGQNIGLNQLQGQQQMGAYGMNADNAFRGAQFNADENFRAGSYNDQNALTQHRQNLSDALMSRSQPLQDLSSMMGLTGMPGFDKAGSFNPYSALTAGSMQAGADNQYYQQGQDRQNKQMETIMAMLGKLIPG